MLLPKLALKVLPSTAAGAGEMSFSAMLVAHCAQGDSKDKSSAMTITVLAGQMSLQAAATCSRRKEEGEEGGGGSGRRNQT